ncbi:hypothetical protein ACFQYP_21070 [Nonomuraea antimicrobica]
MKSAGRPLTGAAVITPAQLSPQAAADYLRACLPTAPSESWRKVLSALETRTVAGLSELAATPLGLWLIRTIFAASGADPAPLAGPLGGEAAALRAHLLDRLIPTLIKARPPSTVPGDHFRPRHRLHPDATRRYLTYLARAFPPDETRDIAWWRIAATLPHTQRTITLVTGLIAGLVIGLVAGLPTGLAAGLIVAVIVGLVTDLRSRSWANELPGHADLRFRGEGRSFFAPSGEEWRASSGPDS